MRIGHMEFHAWGSGNGISYRRGLAVVSNILLSTFYSQSSQVITYEILQFRGHPLPHSPGINSAFQTPSLNFFKHLDLNCHHYQQFYDCKVLRKGKSGTAVTKMELSKKDPR